jgi:acyl-CoA thioesterase I
MLRSLPLRPPLPLPRSLALALAPSARSSARPFSYSHPWMSQSRSQRLEGVIQAARTRRAVIRAGMAAVVPLAAGGLGAWAGGWAGAFQPLLAPFRRPAPPAPEREPLVGPITYVAIGASDTVGFGIPDQARKGWVALLTNELPQPARLVNLGWGGSTLREALARQLPRAVEAQPDLVTVWLAVNDVLGGVGLNEYRADLDHLLGELRTKTRAVVAVGNVPYPADFLDPWGVPEIVRRTVAGSWNRAIAGAAHKHGAVLVDLYGRWRVAEHPEYIGPDGLHPSEAGYASLAETFLAVLRERRVVH